MSTPDSSHIFIPNTTVKCSKVSFSDLLYIAEFFKGMMGSFDLFAWYIWSDSFI